MFLVLLETQGIKSFPVLQRVLKEAGAEAAGRGAELERKVGGGAVGREDIADRRTPPTPFCGCSHDAMRPCSWPEDALGCFFLGPGGGPEVP